jgi:hypothetical protein
MSDSGERPYNIGFGKPPRETRFQPGRSGNPRGRPKGAKNFATAIEEELRATVPVTENGRRRRLSKREVIAKRLVNRVAEGDFKALPLLMNEVRPRETLPGTVDAEEIFGGPEHQPVIDGIVQRIRAAGGVPAAPFPEVDPPPETGDEQPAAHK